MIFSYNATKTSNYSFTPKEIFCVLSSAKTDCLRLFFFFLHISCLNMVLVSCFYDYNIKGGLWFNLLNSTHLKTWNYNWLSTMWLCRFSDVLILSKIQIRHAGANQLKKMFTWFWGFPVDWTWSFKVTNTVSYTFLSPLSTLASRFHIITDEWALLISLWLWETWPFRCDKGFMLGLTLSWTLLHPCAPSPAVSSQRKKDHYRRLHVWSRRHLSVSHQEQTELV